MGQPVSKEGVYPKYIVFHHPDFIPENINASANVINGENAKLEQVKEFTFVLRPDRDHHARVAIAAYAESVRPFDPMLASDLDHILGDLVQGSARIMPT